MCIVWGAIGLGLSSSSWSHIVLHMTQCYTIQACVRLFFVPTVIQMTRHLSFDHWLVEREPMFILAHGRMGHTTLPLTVCTVCTFASGAKFLCLNMRVG